MAGLLTAATPPAAVTDDSGPGTPAVAAVAGVLAVCSLALGAVVGGPTTAVGLFVSLAVVLGGVLWLGDWI